MKDTINISLLKETKNELDKIAIEKGLTRNALIVTIINEFLKKQK
jgi:metal-responsive CopG/Arc/MetJ family transcriptional regulator